MPDIKTRDAVRGTIKTLDRAAIAGQRMKQAYIRTKESAVGTARPAQGSPEEYASERFTNSTEVLTHEGVHQLDRAGHRAVTAARERIQKKRQEENTAQTGPRTANVESPEEAQANFRHRRQVEQLRRQAQANAPSTAPSGTVTPNAPDSPVAGTVPGNSVAHTIPGGPVARTVTGSVDTPITSKPAMTTPGQAPRSVRGRPVSRRTAGRTAERAASASERAVKTKAERYAVKTADRSVKAGIKTAEQTARITQKSAQAAARTAQVTAHAARIAAQKAAATARTVTKAVIASVKAIIAATKSLVTAIAAGGSVAFLIIVVVCLIGLVVGSVFGIFFSGEDTGTGLSMRSAVRQINADYQQKIDGIKNSVAHDELEMSGSRATWPEVLAVYAVKTNTDPTDAQEVASMTERKRDILEDIFWEMNAVSYRTTTDSHVETTTGADENGDPIEIQTTVETVTLYITVTHKAPGEMADQLHFNAKQRKQLTELLSDEYRTVWNTVLYGIGIGDDGIVAVALSQVGNVGGQPYWSWYGYSFRVAWCAIFVSWCAEQCGYLDTGVIPRFEGVPTGQQWFKDRGQWADRYYEPNPGDIIFFDWASDGLDGWGDHVGIVEKCENGIVYTIEGNSGDSCRQVQYSVGYYQICGYGIPDYTAR